jgi:protein-tyrosine phosphatase
LIGQLLRFAKFEYLAISKNISYFFRKVIAKYYYFLVNSIVSDNQPSQIWETWCVNYGPDKQRYLLCFSAIREELSREGGCVYIHCKSGKDRSAFTVYSLLRLEYGFSDEAARAALETRLGTR